MGPLHTFCLQVFSGSLHSLFSSSPTRSSLIPMGAIRWFLVCMPVARRDVPASTVLTDWVLTPSWTWSCSVEPVLSPLPRSTNLVRTPIPELYSEADSQMHILQSVFRVFSWFCLDSVGFFPLQGRNFHHCSPTLEKSQWQIWTSWGFPMETWEPQRLGSTCRRYTQNVVDKIKSFES